MERVRSVIARIGRPFGEKMLDLGNLIVAGTALGSVLRGAESPLEGWALAAGFAAGIGFHAVGCVVLYCATREAVS